MEYQGNNTKNDLAKIVAKVIKPRGFYNRGQFFFAFFVPIAVFIVIVPWVWKISWEIEKLLIKVIFYAGLFVFDTHLICYLPALILVLFLIYLIIIALIKRIRDLNISGFWVVLIIIPIIGVLFLVYLLFWPGKSSGAEEGIKNRRKNILTVIFAFVVLLVFLIGFLFSLAYFVDTLSSLQTYFSSVPLRIWNQTEQVITVQVITLNDTVYQQYFVDKLMPGEIVKNEDILICNGKYVFKARSPDGNTIYTKDFSLTELNGIHWTIIISP